jgi:hypothetical protein
MPVDKEIFGDLSKPPAGDEEIFSDKPATVNTSIAAQGRNRRKPEPYVRGEFDPTRGGSTLKFGLPFAPDLGSFDTGIPLSEGFTNFLAGAGRANMRLGQGTKQIFGLGPTRQEVDEQNRLDVPLMRNPAGIAGNVIDDLAKVVPTMFIPGVNTVTGGALLGGAMGATRPVGVEDSRIKNAYVSAAFGAAVPAAVATYRGAKSLLQPLSNAGQDKIITNAMVEAAGGPERAALAATKLQQSADPLFGAFRPGQERLTAGELVPGSVPTVAQRADNAGLAALQRAAVATSPASTITNTERMGAQNAARIRSLEDMAGTDGLRMFAREELKSTADDLYRQAFANGMDIRRDALTGQFLSKAEQAARNGEITKLMKNPYIAESVDEAKKLMLGDFKRIDNVNGSVEGLHYMKKALDDKIARATGNEQRILIGARDRLLTTIDALSPEYAAARAVFRDMAKPVNQMDTAAEILKNSVTPRGNMTLDKFARSNTDKSAVSAQQFKKATLEGTFSNEQMNRLGAIDKDLRGADFAATAGRDGNSDTVQKLAYSNMISQLGVPNMIRMVAPGQIVGRVAARGADLLYADANRQMAEKLAQTMMSPEAAAALLLRYGKPQSTIIPRVASKVNPLLAQVPPYAGLLGYSNE